MTTAELPAGDAPRPLSLPHFPTRWQAVVWRNWGLVPLSRLAEVLQTTQETLKAAADDLGLDPEEPLQESWLEKSYLSFIRANWHLLDYSQMLRLLDWSADRLFRVLNEEDFLWSKLGRMKPNTGKVHYEGLTPDQRQATEEIRKEIGKYFDGKPSGYIDAPFSFLKKFGAGKFETDCPACHFDFNCIHSYCAGCGDVFSDIEKRDPVPKNLLEQYASMGVRGVWIHALLRDFYPVPGAEEYSQGRESRLENLRKIVARCKKYGIGVYLYLNEPRFMPSGFYRKFPHWGGWELPDGGSMTVCTTRTQEPLTWLEDGIRFLFSEVRDLAGLFCIAMSENPTNCNYASSKEKCPCCRNVPADKIIADVICAMERGMHSVNPDAKMIAYDWAWRPFRQSQDNVPFKRSVLERLPASVYVASVSEWGMITNVGNVRQYLKDYSISQVGPSEESLKTWSTAAQLGMKTVAKIQINNSWELSAVPYIPVPYLIQEHLQNLRNAGISGLILSWTLGGFPGGNLKLLSDSPEKIAASMFHPELAENICRAWKCFSEAFREFPFHNSSVLYRGPQNYGPMNLLHRNKTGFSASMLGFPYDDLETWRGPYPEDVFEEQFRKMTDLWRQGLELLRHGEQPSDDEKADYDEILSVAEVCFCHFGSAYCQIRFVRARDNGFQVETMRECVKEEIALALKLYELVQKDSRFGFEASNHYYYSLNDLREKVISCSHILKQLSAEMV